MAGAWIVAAKRTPVMPKGGAFNNIPASSLGAAVINAVRGDVDVPHIDQVIFGNALYGGGNPARVAALEAGLDESTPALSLDTQCCSGLDAISLAASRVRSGDADAIICGGLESYSRAPIRQHRPLKAGAAPVAYDRPPFTPWPDRDPDMLDAAAALAEARSISRADQDAYAVESHRRASNDTEAAREIIPVAGHDRDGFTRTLSTKACARLPVLAGTSAYGLSAATTAVEADAASALLVVSDRIASAWAGPRIQILGAETAGFDPTMPALAPVVAVHDLLARMGVMAGDIAYAEIMEAFAVQAMACISDLDLDPAVVNQRGGALARGHPIGASGAVLVVRLFHDLAARGRGALGLAAIAAAGGLGSAMMMRAQS